MTFVVGMAVGALALAAEPTTAWAYGESVDGFPNWSERVMHEWTNRARAEPSVEMADCGANCPEGACYTPTAPALWNLKLNRAARFHSDHMAANGYFAHNSNCPLVSNIDSLYPATCQGAAACACEQNGTNTAWSARVQLFGNGTNGEIIAGSGDPNSAFYQWLFEDFDKTACQYDMGPPTNGHRWHLLKTGPSVGFGRGAASSADSVGDFGAGGEAYKIPSGSHYPRQSASVEAWANWYDTAGPQSALVNVGGTCTAMTLQRGTVTNGAYRATLTNVASGCHRYFFLFKDSGGNVVTYPSTGSLGIGPAGSCADWDTSRPATGAGCDCTPQCTGKTCGDDGCGGSCGDCGAGITCSDEGVCEAPHGDGGPGGGNNPDGGLDGGGDDGGGCGCASSSGSGGALALVGLIVGFAVLRRRRR